MKLRIIFACSFLCIQSFARAEVAIMNSQGEFSIIELRRDIPFQEVIRSVESLNESEENALDQIIYTSNQSKLAWRSYEIEVTDDEKGDLKYILKMMANKPLTTLLRYKRQLEQAGDRLKHIHPLRFLMTIFTDEELKVCIHNIRKRGWVWGDFYKGLSQSLADEKAQGNLTAQMVRDFSQIVGIEFDEISHLVDRSKWTDFVDTLITRIPREGNPGRYDM